MKSPALLSSDFEYWIQFGLFVADQESVVTRTAHKATIAIDIRTFRQPLGIRSYVLPASWRVRFDQLR